MSESRLPARPSVPEVDMPRLCGLLTLVLLPTLATAEAPSFTNEVVPLLTRTGCNQGSCHGKAAGQNGFRLSLRGYAPELDHRWLTREFDARRLVAAEPGESLLLKKAVGQVPHAGGRVIVPGSREYKLLEDWLAAGTPGPNASDPIPVKLELVPNDRTMVAGERIALAAWATFADGSRRDVTWLTKFDTNDPAVAATTPGGQITAIRTGATAVRAMYQTEVAACGVSVPGTGPIDAAKFTGRNNFIDDHVFARLKALHIEPSGPSSDGQFARRAWLDACGRLPPAENLAKFLADRDPDKRSKLVDELLARPEFTDYWAMLLAELFQNRRERDHDVRGIKGVRGFHAWIREQVAANRPWDKLARDVLTAAGNTRENPQVGYYVVTVGEHRHGEQSEVAESVAQAFLGTRIGCAKCHNHPLERYTQDDFYHFAAFFSRVKLDRQEPKVGPTALRVSHPEQGENRKPVGVSQPRTGAFMAAQPLDRSKTEIPAGTDPRTVLADWVVGTDAFAGAMVNRVWKHYFNVGMVEPVDDLRATNPPSLPGLWAELAAKFRADGFDLRKLMRVVLTSRAYQLDSATTPGNATDARFYSHYYARRLPAEVLLDAMTDASGVPVDYDGYPHGSRATQLADPVVGAGPFLRQFGRSDRVTACACEKTGDVTLPQLLLLQNGGDMNAAVYAGGSWLRTREPQLADDDALLDELYLRTLARAPRPAERAAVKRLLAAEDRTQRPNVYFDLMWAVLNAKEFAFNH